jgi:energy-converting hydrogenase Eha subunit E
VLRRYGWCQSLDTTVTGRLCIRGAQNVLEKTGHVTPQARQRAVHYLQQALAEIGVRMAFFAWNDLPDQTFTAVENRLVRAIHLARQNGE